MNNGTTPPQRPPRLTSPASTILLIVLLTALAPSALYGQTQIDDINTTSLDATDETYTVNGKTVNHGVNPDEDVFLDAFVISSLTYTPENTFDSAIIRRNDNGPAGQGYPFGTKSTVWYQGTCNNGSCSSTANIFASRVSTELEAISSRILNQGSDNTFDNNRSQAAANNNVERIDLIFSTGITITSASQLDYSGFPIFERSGNDDFGVAAITSIDGAGNPDGYDADMDGQNDDIIIVSNNTGTDLTTGYSFVNFRTFPNTGLLEPFDSGGNQNIKGVFVTLGDLGLSVGQTIYGYSLFGPDVGQTSSCASLNLVDFTDSNCFPFSTTGGADIISGDSYFILSGDADGDGISDVIEGYDPDTPANSDDNDDDGIPNYLDIDSDDDGLTDVTETGANPISPDDTDNDGLPNYLDIDSDADGLPDNIEAQDSAGFVSPSGTDSDGDGLDDIYDQDTSSGDPATSAGLTPFNFDGTDQPDYLDDDSDNDGAPDDIEGHDQNENGELDGGEATPTGSDTDGDGLDDGFEGEFGTSYTPPGANNVTNGVTDPVADLPNKSGQGNTDEPDFRDVDVVLPVELTSFEAIVDGKAVVLRWDTASETNNAGFDVQVRKTSDTEEMWTTLAFVDGHGTTTEPRSYHHRTATLEAGTHTFRLKQIDFDGAFEYSPEVEVVIGLPGAYVVEPTYPNPFNPEATLRFAVQQEQQVQVTLYNLLGQRVQTLFAGTATSGQMQRVTIDGSELSSGIYLVRVRGERFLETQQVTLVK